MDNTQLAGTIGCAVAALACASRWQGRWFAPAAVFAGMAADIHLNTRYVVRVVMREWLFAHGLPVLDQRPFQVAVLIVAAIGLLLVIRRLAVGAGGLRQARLGAFLIGALWCLEAISLHATDRVMWTPAGPILLGAWLWLGACALAIWGAIWGGGGAGR